MMRSAVLTDTETIELHEVDRPEAGPDEVLVRMREVGICGSDVHYWEHGRIGDFVVEGPLVLGHESAGVVETTGDAVSGIEPGDRVALEPGVPCRRCSYCLRGHYHLCPDIEFMATPPDNGAFSEYVAWPADFVHPLPDGVSMREGALCEPLSVGLHATELADIEPGNSVLITGAGPIGLVTLETVTARGAGPVAITDIVPAKLERARNRGARAAIDVSDVTVEDAVADLTDGSGFDVVIEASGSRPAYQTALDAVGVGGTVVCLGLPTDGVIPIDVVELAAREVRLQGSFRFANTYPAALELLTDGQVDVAGLVDETYPIDDISTGFEQTRSPEIVKVMITL